jgi:hypothetical protein
MLVAFTFYSVGAELVERQGEHSRTGRDLRAGQRHGMDCTGTWEILRIDQ